MRGRPTKYNNEDVVLKAQRVFWEKGYSATSLTDLKEATELGSGSFYNTFRGGKKEIFSKAIQQRRVDFIAFKNLCLNSENPINLIRDFFLKLADENFSTHMRGCIIANTVTELSFVDDALEQEAIQILLEVEEMFREIILSSQQKGIIQNRTDAKILAKYLITLWNGLNVTRKLHPQPSTLKELIEYQLGVLV